MNPQNILMISYTYEAKFCRTTPGNLISLIIMQTIQHVSFSYIFRWFSRWHFTQIEEFSDGKRQLGDILLVPMNVSTVAEDQEDVNILDSEEDLKIAESVAFLIEGILIPILVVGGILGKISSLE